MTTDRDLLSMCDDLRSEYPPTSYEHIVATELKRRIETEKALVEQLRRMRSLKGRLIEKDEVAHVFKRDWYELMTRLAAYEDGE